MPWTRASELERTLECQSSLILPQNHEKSKSAMEAAAWGTIAHHWKALGTLPTTVPGYDNLLTLFEKRKETWPDREALWPSHGKHEVAVGLDCLTGAVAWNEEEDGEKRDAWKQSLPESWISGTLDYHSDLFGTPWVDDLKTGREPPDYARHPQFLFYGLVAYRLAVSSGDLPDHLLLSCTHWPRYPIDHGATRKYAHVTAETLDVFQKRLRLAYDNWRWQRDKQRPDPVPGDHCQWCPARMSCPMI